MADRMSRFEYPVLFAANAQFVDITLPSGANAGIGDAEIKNGAKISGAKTRRRLSSKYSQGNIAAVSETKVLHVARGVAGEVLGVRVTNIARATGAATVTFNVRKNGVTILTANVAIDATHPSTGATYGYVDGVLDPAQTSYVNGDIFDVVVTATAGGGVLPTGVALDMIHDEDPV